MISGTDVRYQLAFVKIKQYRVVSTTLIMEFHMNFLSSDFGRSVGEGQRDTIAGKVLALHNGDPNLIWN